MIPFSFSRFIECETITKSHAQTIQALYEKLNCYRNFFWPFSWLQKTLSLLPFFGKNKIEKRLLKTFKCTQQQPTYDYSNRKKDMYLDLRKTVLMIVVQN